MLDLRREEQTSDNGILAISVGILWILMIGVWLFAGLYGKHVMNTSIDISNEQIQQLNQTTSEQFSIVYTTINIMYTTVQTMFGSLAKIIAGANPPPPSLTAPPGSIYLASITNTIWYYVAGSGWQLQVDCKENQGPPGPTGATGATGATGPPGQNGTSLVPTGPWNANTTYYVDNIVLNNNTWYISIVTNINVLPGSDNGTVWMVGPTGSGAGNPTSGFFYPIVSISQTNSGGSPAFFNSSVTPDTSSTLFAVWQNTVTIVGSTITVHDTGIYSFNVNADYLGQLVFNSSKINLIVTQTRSAVSQNLYTGSYLVQQQDVAVSWSNNIYMMASDMLSVSLQYLLDPGDTLDVTGSMSLQQIQ